MTSSIRRPGGIALLIALSLYGCGRSTPSEGPDGTAANGPQTGQQEADTATAAGESRIRMVIYPNLRSGESATYIDHPTPERVEAELRKLDWTDPQPLFSVELQREPDYGENFLRAYGSLDPADEAAALALDFASTAPETDHIARRSRPLRSLDELLDAFVHFTRGNGTWESIDDVVAWE